MSPGDQKSGELKARAKSLAFAIGAFAVLLIVSQLMKGSGANRGTPSGILFLGLVYGLMSALVAAGLILVYRTSRIINFAQAALGGAGGIFAYHLMVAETTNFPYFVAVPFGIIVAGLLGIGVELAFVRRFFNSPRLVLTVVTIAIIPALGFASGFIANLPLFGEPSERSAIELGGGAPIPLPFSGFSFTIGDLSLPLGFAHLFAFGLGIAALVGLAAFFRFTRAGVAIRAAAENSDRAMLLGINVKGLSTLVWAVTGVLSGVGVILTATVSGSFTGVANGDASVIIAPLAAAVVARMRSIPVAVAGAIWLETLRQSIRWSYEGQLGLFDAFLFLVILFALLAQRKELGRSEDQEISSWKATEEIRPTPKEMLDVGGVKLWRWVFIGIALLVILVLPWTVSTGVTNQAGFVAIIGIVILSLVVLTGWAGQVSLGQFALVALGAVIGGAITAKVGWSFWIAIPIGIVLTAIFSMLIGLPALRIKGLFLAVTTFAFAFAVQSNLFEERYFGWLLPDRITRPTLFLFDFEDERSMYYLTLLAFVLSLTLVTVLRRSRPGRVLIALRENPNNIQAFGINVVRTRLAAFALSGGLCGFAGVLLAHHQRAVSAANFPASESLQVFIFSVIGGLGSVAGAVLGSIYFALNRLFGQSPLLALVIGPAGLLILLYIAPGGLSSLVFGVRDGILRIVAQRRRMVVPSLFQDIDPEAIRRQVAPLGEPILNTGLSAIPMNRRYRGASDLYATRGRLRADKTRAPDDEGAISTAAAVLEEGAVPENQGTRAIGEAAEVAKEVQGR